MFKIMKYGLTLFLLPTPALAQQVTCGMAQYQLQQYVFQVNNFASIEANQNIPGRCGVNWACANWWYQQLNMWYAQQAYMVNNYYRQIAQECTNNPNQNYFPTHGPVDARNNQIPDDATDDLDIDDVDKTLAIRIPNSPPAFASR